MRNEENYPTLVIYCVSLYSKKRSIVSLAKAEMEPDRIAKVSDILDKIAEPEKIADKNESNSFSKIKDSIYSKKMMGDRYANSIHNAISKNTSSYSYSNLKNESKDYSVKNISNNIQNFFSNDSKVVKNFQNVYKTTSGNLYNHIDKISKLASSRPHVEKFQREIQVTTLAKGALEELRGILTPGMSVNSLNAKVEVSPTKISTALTNFLKEFKKAADQKLDPAINKYSALKTVLSQGATLGDADSKTFLSNAKNIVNDAITENKSDEIKSVEDISQTDANFVDTKQMWSKFYGDSPVPISANIRNRKEWLASEITEINSILEGIFSKDDVTRKSAFSQIGKILPIAILSNYSAFEIAQYLLAKLKGAEEALGLISHDNEDDLVNVKNKIGKQQEMSAELELD